TLDRELFIARGDMIAHAQRPAPSGRRLKARIFWLHDSPLATGASVSVRIGSAETRGAITKIWNVLDPGDQSAASRDAASWRVGACEWARRRRDPMDGLCWPKSSQAKSHRRRGDCVG